MSIEDFNLTSALDYSWNVLWAAKLADRKAYLTKPTHLNGAAFYITASDLERQVRACAQATHEGKPWPTEDRTYSTIFGYGRHGFKFRGNLKRAVRDWLFAQVGRGKLTYHNFGRGHISGARFRPVGEPMGAAERKTIKKHEQERIDPKPKPRHYNEHGYGGRPLCTEARRSRFSRPNHRIWTTKDKVNVTCPRCRKILGLGRMETCSDTK